MILNSTGNDPFDLARFVNAQQGVYESALAELRAGRKQAHWMWFVFPQIDGLGLSSTTKHYAIKNLQEAQAYLDHPILGPRLRTCAEAMLGVDGRSAHDILGSPDDLKLQSSMTLFSETTSDTDVFAQVLAKFYGGKRDEKSTALMANLQGSSDQKTPSSQRRLGPSPVQDVKMRRPGFQPPLGRREPKG